jgi:hypothetical protein
MADETGDDSWDMDMIGIMMTALAAVSFSLAGDVDGELALVLRGVGAVLLGGGLLVVYRS